MFLGASECWFPPLRKEGVYGWLSESMTILKGNIKIEGPILLKEWVGSRGWEPVGFVVCAPDVKSSGLPQGGGWLWLGQLPLVLWVSLAPPKTWRLHKTRESGWELLGYCSRILWGESQGRMNSEGEGQVMLSAVSRDLTPPLHSHTQRTLQMAGDDSWILPSSARPGPENVGYPDPRLWLEKVSIFWAAHRTHSAAQPQAPTLWPFPDH